MRTQFEGFLISSCYMGIKESRWGADASQHHKINVQYNGSKAVSFDYWASKAEPHIKTREQLLSAFACILLEAQTGRDYTLDEWAEETGYMSGGMKLSEIIDIHESLVDMFIKIDHIVDGDWDAVDRAYEKLSEEGLV